MISLAVTHYNRPYMLMECFEKVQDDPRIGEIIIQDDASDATQFQKIIKHYQTLGNLKIKIYRNLTNQGVYRNKYYSVLNSQNQWVIVFDSDNIIGVDYIDRIYSLRQWDESLVYCPDYAKTEFNYKLFAGHVISRSNVSEFYKWKRFDCLINTMNCFVNRQKFIEAFDPIVDPIAADSAYFNYQWLKRDHAMYVVPDLEYVHRIHPGSHYVQNQHRSNEFHALVMDNFKNMK